MMQEPCFDFEAMRNVDIVTVDPATLVDIRDTKVNMKLPHREKVLDYVRQIKNPYCFRCGDVVVKISHADTEATINDCMETFYGAVSKSIFNPKPHREGSSCSQHDS